MAAGAVSTAACVILLLLVFLPGAVPASNILTDPGDAAVMRALSDSLGASSSPLGWSDSADPCTWIGVNCRLGRVTTIQVGNSSLAGTLPAGDVSLRNLTFLSHLDLMNNEISGALPSLSGLGNLEVLRLHQNNFSAFPPEGPGAVFAGLTSLRNVSLDQNPLPAWQLPESLQDASRLTSLDANKANLIGSIPDFLGTAFSTLNNLGLSYNSFTGEIPAAFSELSSLRTLGLTQNALSGGISVIAKMTSLVMLKLNMNSFTGSLPDFSQLGNLQVLDVRDNQLTGPVPSSLNSLPKLTKVVLTNNLFQGPVPMFRKELTVDMIVTSERFCLTEPGECDSRVNVLLAIAASFGYPIEFAQAWKGNDPCSVAWLGITCDNTKNVSIVNLSDMRLNGTVSPDFARLSSLQKVILSNNNLTGTIPPEIATLKSLKLFDVSNNSLWGKVPSFGAGVTVHTDGNPNIGKDAPPRGGVGGGGDGKGGDDGGDSGSGCKSSSSRLGLIVGVVAAAIFVVLLIIAFFVCSRCRRRKHKVDSTTEKLRRSAASTTYSDSDAELIKSSVPSMGFNSWESNSCSNASDVPIFDGGNLKVSIEVLRRVTNNFSQENILGRGGFGTVYKGVLSNGTWVAVKRMEGGHGVTESGNKGLTEFQSEISVLTRARHKHLVSLLGYCLQENERILVYEYMPQGTLSDHLFNWAKEGTRQLDWKRRLIIALDVARGVEYLHGLAHRTFIHRDLKPSNILLGDDMRAKVADFGLVRLAPEDTISVETRLAGTFGYLAPEYATTGRLTIKADVYSFGVILMELISGRRALDNSQPEESVHLVTWFRRLQIHETVSKVVDPLIELDDETTASIERVAELAGQCCVRNPHDRPAMGHVVNVLSTLAESWMPKTSSLNYGYVNDFSMTLPAALGKWQSSEDTAQADGTTASTSSCIQSSDNSQSSIPTTSRDFAKTFTSGDAR